MAITRTRRPTGGTPTPIKKDTITRTRRPTGGTPTPTPTPVKKSTTTSTTSRSTTPTVNTSGMNVDLAERAAKAQQIADARAQGNALISQGATSEQALSTVAPTGSLYTAPEKPAAEVPQDNTAALMKMFQDMMAQNQQGLTTQNQGFTDQMSKLAESVAALQSGTTARNEQLAAQRQSLNEQLQRINDPQYFQNALQQVMEGYQPMLEAQQRQIGEQYGDLATETQRRLDIDQARRGVFPARFSGAQTQEALSDVDTQRMNALNDAMAQMQARATGDVRNLTNQQLQSLQQIGAGLGVDLNALVQQGQLGLQGLGLQGDLAQKGFQVPTQLDQGQQRIDLQERQVGVQESAEGRQQALTGQQLERGEITNRFLEPQMQQALQTGDLRNISTALGINEQQMRQEYLPNFLENQLTREEQQIMGNELANIASSLNLEALPKKLLNEIEAGDLKNAYQSMVNLNLPAEQQAQLDRLAAQTFATRANAETSRINALTNQANTELAEQKWSYNLRNPSPQDLIKDMNTFSTVLEKNFTIKDAFGKDVLDRDGVAKYLKALALNPEIESTPMGGVVEALLGAYGGIGTPAPSPTDVLPTAPTGGFDLGAMMGLPQTLEGSGQVATPQTLEGSGGVNPFQALFGDAASLKQGFNDAGIKGFLRALEGNPVRTGG